MPVDKLKLPHWPPWEASPKGQSLDSSGGRGTFDKSNAATAKSPANIRHVLILPIIARSIETGWSFGLANASTFHLKKGDTVTRTSNAEALALYTTRRQFVAALNGSIYFPGERFIFNEQLSYSSFPDDFWGLGKKAEDSAKESYKFKQYYIYLHPQFLVGRSLYLGILYAYQRVFDVDYDRGRLFDKENVRGRYGYHVSGPGASLTFDTRNNAFAPDRGVMLQFYINPYSSFFGSDYQFTNYVVDLRRYSRIYKDQVLAMQVWGSWNSGDVPLRSLAYLGGANTMRGYYAGRFRDKNAAAVQAEYRVPVWWRFGVVGFGSIGNVGPKFSDINLESLKYSFGGGVRFALNREERLNLRLDYGITMGSQGFYLQLGEAF
ncbi:MAG TPA: BamA/TamA family outer membrane protein [Puia sp.]|nr:BamA/TamA family outer membrane protein [Puia sp.]